MHISESARTINTRIPNYVRSITELQTANCYIEKSIGQGRRSRDEGDSSSGVLASLYRLIELYSFDQ
jgi:hypothetical protein